VLDSTEYYYRKAAKLGTTNATTYYYLGRLALLQRPSRGPNNSEAITFLLKAIALDSTYSTAQYYLAETYRNEGEYSKAAQRYTKYLQRDSTPKEAYFYAGYSYYFSDNTIANKYAIAESYFNKYLGMVPNHRNSYYWLAGIKAIQKDTSTAKKNYLRSVAIDSSFTSGWYWLGNLYREQHSNDSARRAYEKIIVLDSTYSDAYSALGYLYLKNYRDTIKALGWFERIIKQFPADPWSYYHITCYYSLQGNIDKALTYLELSLQKGFKDEPHVKTNDSDLEPLRTTARFKQLMQQYFPVKQ
jgi:adenylate cyclase